MDLKPFNYANTRMRRPGTPAIRFDYKKGVIGISKEAAEMMKLKEGDKVEFFQDEKNKEDWYIGKTKNSDGLIVRSNGKMSGLLLNNVVVCRKIAESAGIEQSASYLVSKKSIKHNGHDLWPIITSSYNTRGRQRKNN